MAIEDAAKSLREYFNGHSWLTAVGICQNDGSQAIFLYVKRIRKTDLRFLESGWEGYPVVIKQMGTPRLISTTSL